MENLQLLSVNVRGLNTDEKRKKCYAWLNELKTDIIFLQETHFIEKNEKKYNFGWRGKLYHAFSNSTYSRGVSILFKENIDVQVYNVNRSNDGRKLLLNLEINDYKFTVVNIYAPNDNQNRIDFLKSF